MSNYELDYFSSPDCRVDLTDFSSTENFFFGVEFAIKKKNEPGIITFYFYLCDRKGFDCERYAGELKFVEIVNYYSYNFLKDYIKEKVEAKLIELDDQESF